MATNVTRLADGSPLYVKMAEEWLVGAALLAEASEVSEVTRYVSPKDFRDQTLGVIWNAVVMAAESGEPSIPRVADVLLQQEWLDRIGSEPRLVDLTGEAQQYLAALTLGGMVAHAKIIREWSQKRGVIRQALRTANDALNGKRTSYRGGVSWDVNVA